MSKTNKIYLKQVKINYKKIAHVSIIVGGLVCFHLKHLFNLWFFNKILDILYSHNYIQRIVQPNYTT
jgi:1,4-dihydroxy-2-naphthoate octaprenyltransferase